MQAIVFPATQTTLNTTGLIQACREMRQPNPTNKPDAKGLTGFKHTVATLDEIQKRPYLTGNILHMGYMILAHWNDMSAILSHASMSHVYHDGLTDGACVIVTGSVNQWIDVCRRACCPESEQVVRFVFNKIYRHLESVVPREMLYNNRRDFGDGTFLLEHHK